MTAVQCPCGSGLTYGQCCEPCHLGRAAASPQALMRSRYSAFVLELEEYLRLSWHASTRPEGPLLAKGTRWTGLQVLDHSESGDQGEVAFVATFQEANSKDWYQLQERSWFLREDGHWQYLEGNANWLLLKPGRNDVCPCGSGRKFKKCCG